MDAFIFSLLILPAITGILVLILPKAVARTLVFLSALSLSAIAVYLLITLSNPYYFGIPLYINHWVSGADILLLLFFGWVAIKRKSWLIGLLTILQLGTLVYLLKYMPAEKGLQFMADKLSVFMFLVINILSSIIAIFSLQYIEQEDCSNFRKKYFLSILFFFIAVMNGIVVADNLEYFFLFFELTTLASFLFIGFRKDETSVKNAITALWMNQIGGLAILAAIFFILYNGFGAATFSNLLAHAGAAGIYLPLALLCIAALIKGAQMPFSKWLLGAMVAPTPVSALLHSSTMVKIAPFIILRLSPALKNTPVATVVIAFTAFVFIAAAIASLAQDNLKRILAHSTIALLALMIMMGAVGTPVTVVAALILIFFHGISKCMLFLNAGILEKVFHTRETSDMDKLAETGPFTSLIITIGFMSLLLPPFGAFIGKWFSIETLANGQKILGAWAIIAIATGGAVLSLLYFKVLGLLITRSGEKDRYPSETINPIYSGTMYLLMGLVLGSVISFPLLLTGFFAPIASQTLQLPLDISSSGWNIYIGTVIVPVIPLLIAFLLLPVTIILAKFIKFKNTDRAKEYACGEKTNYSFSSFYFSTDKALPYFYTIGIASFILLILVAIW